jgi:tetratricopeptide (TPR) repeat protein
VTSQGNATFMPPHEALTYANRCLNDGRVMEAEAICHRLLDVQPDLPEAEHLLGIIAHHQGKLGEAIGHVQRAIKLAPGIALFHANLGEMQRLAGRPKLAVEAARRALAIEPAMTAALSNLGVALCELEDYQEAARAQRKAVAADPNFAEAHCNLGNALHGLKRFDEAAAAYRRALELKPDYADAWANLGTTLHHGGDFDEGIFALRRAIALAPHHANAHSGLGILLLMRGEFGEGWDEYEWRLRSTERKGPRFPQKPWQGEALAGKHIYVEAEQGLGDTLHFARYLPLLAARAGKVTLRAHQQIVALLRESFSGITVLGDRGEPEPYECDAALLSLPRLLQTRLETLPASVPYLRVPAAAAARWRKRFAKMAGVKVGLVWAGNPDHVNDHRRSLALTALTPLLAVRGVSFASLQVGPRAADVRKRRRRKPAIQDVSADLLDFTDTAGAVAALDLVLTVDTSVAHLAGALGKPVWLLLPWVTDWRWLLGREDCPWYPTMRLFRQKEGDDWTGVIARVAKELAAVARGNTAALMPFKADGERRAARAAAVLAAQTAQAAAALGQAQAITPGEALVRAERMRQRGLLADADELSRRAIAADPHNAEAEHTLGIIAHQSGKAAEAIEHLRRAIALKPDVALYHANLGEMYRLSGRADEAIAAARRALEIRPDYPEALSNLGIALFERGQFEEAITHYERAIALQDNFAQAHSNRGNAL